MADTMRKLLFILILAISGLSLGVWRSQASPAQIPAGNPVIPGSIQVDATFHHIGVVWWIQGDDDLDSSFWIEIRKTGDSTWSPGAPGVRAYPTLEVNGSPLNINSWGASAMFLDPGTNYEIRLHLSDPDGGGDTRVVTGTTRTLPQPDPNGRHLQVVPGNGGGDGSPSNPFQGLQAAADAAQPGDTFQIASGTYSPFEIQTSGLAGKPITFQGPNDGSAVIDGSGTNRGVVTLGVYNQILSHIIFSGMTVQNGHWGIDAQNTQDIYLHHNLIQDVDFGIYNRRGNHWERNQTICDNTILGRTSWPGSGIPSERGIDLKGTGNVVCHNTVQNFGDCVSVQPSTGSAFGNDVFGNDAAYCVDDGIEIDYNQANARVWRNRVYNARMGVSVQPIYGGPAYIIRNEFFNLESVPIKMHNQTTGFLVAHNTGAKHGNGHGDNGAMWRNATFRNNLFLGTRYAFEFTTVPDEGFRDLDYNAWGTTRVIGSGGPFFKWNNVRYDKITDLPPGVEDHGLEAGFGDLISSNLPADWDVAVPPGSRDLRLNASVPEIDSGIALPNLNDPFVMDGSPDMGAFESGQDLPLYGPRPLVPDLSSSYKKADRMTPGLGEIVTYEIVLRNSGAVLTETVTLTDTLPAGLQYLAGSLQASSGVVNEGTPPTLGWQGTLESNPVVTITYQASVSTSTQMVLINSAEVNAGGLPSNTLQAIIFSNGNEVFLPFIKDD